MYLYLQVTCKYRKSIYLCEVKILSRRHSAKNIYLLAAKNDHMPDWV